MNDPHQFEKAWHSIPKHEVLAELGVEAEGISSADALSRLERYGENRIEEGRGTTAWERIKRQLTSILIMILIASALLAGAVGAWLDAFVILAVVLANTLIGYLQEGKAERAIEAIESRRADTPFESGEEFIAWVEQTLGIALEPDIEEEDDNPLPPTIPLLSAGSEWFEAVLSARLDTVVLQRTVMLRRDGLNQTARVHLTWPGSD